MGNKRKYYRLCIKIFWTNDYIGKLYSLTSSHTEYTLYSIHLNIK